MFSIPNRELTGHVPAAEQAPYVVALHAEGAPCGLVFFDGSERWVEADGVGVILPGGAFFAKEARAYASEEEALAQAVRLNRASPVPDRPWRAIPLRGLAGAESWDAPSPRRDRDGPRRAALRWRR